MKSNVKRAKKIKHNGVYGAYQHQKKKRNPETAPTQKYIYAEIRTSIQANATGSSFINRTAVKRKKKRGTVKKEMKIQ